MGDLTEREIFACMVENFRLAEEHCRLLAVLPAKGPTYSAFRNELRRIEGSCRQAAYWRENANWLQIGLLMAEAHKRAGFWLRRRYPAPLFLKLADNLHGFRVAAERMRTAKTGKTGTILPEVAKPFRDTTAHTVSLPEGVIKRESGLIVPAN